MKKDANSSQCPICGTHLTKTNIKSHFTHHWNNANSNINEKKKEWIHETRKKNRKAAVVAMKKFSSKKDFLEDDNERLLSRVKNNRVTRVNILREKTKRKYTKKYEEEGKEGGIRRKEGFSTMNNMMGKQRKEGRKGGNGRVCFKQRHNRPSCNHGR